MFGISRDYGEASVMLHILFNLTINTQYILVENNNKASTLDYVVLIDKALNHATKPEPSYKKKQPSKSLSFWAHLQLQYYTLISMFKS